MTNGLSNTSAAATTPGARARTGGAGAASADSAGWTRTMHDAVARKSNTSPPDSQPKSPTIPAPPSPGHSSAAHKNTRKTAPNVEPASNPPSSKDTKQVSRSERKKKTSATPVSPPPVAVAVKTQASPQGGTSTRSDSSRSLAKKAHSARASHPNAKDGLKVARANTAKPGGTPEKTTGAGSRLASRGPQATDAQQPGSQPPATPRATRQVQVQSDSGKTPARVPSPGQRQRQSAGSAGASQQPLSGYANRELSPTGRGRAVDARVAKAAHRSGAGQKSSSPEASQISRPSRTDRYGTDLASTGTGHQIANSNGTLPSPTGVNSGLQGTAQSTASNPASAPSATPLNPQSLASLNAQIHTMHQAGGGQTRIDLHPASLGSVQIHLQMQGQQQAQVSFNAAHASTAQAIQASLPQLIASMQQQGIQLAQPQVHVQNNTNGQNAPSHPGQSGMGQQGQSQNPDGHGGRQQSHTALATREVAARETPREPATHAGVRAYA